MSQATLYEQLRPVVGTADVAFLISCAATALVFYEHLITIRLEVQQIWNRHISGVTILFILTRYITLLNRVSIVVSLMSLRTIESCNIITWMQAATTSLLVVVMSVIAAVRVYALWDRDLRLFAVVLLTGLFPAFANVFFRSASTVFLVPTKIYTCQLAPTGMSIVVYRALSVTTRVVGIISDGLVVVLTWMKTYNVFLMSRKMKFQTNYSALILRDGTLYFLAVCILNLVAIIYAMEVGVVLLNDLIVTLSTLLMARFLLNMRDQRTRNESMPFRLSEATLAGSRVSSIHFASHFADSMGGSVGSEEGTDTNMDDVEDDISDAGSERRDVRSEHAPKAI